MRKIKEQYPKPQTPFTPAALSMNTQHSGDAFLKNTGEDATNQKTLSSVKSSPPPVMDFTGGLYSTPVQRTPYKEEIESSFGRHDISNVKAQTGDNADEANKALGAKAYTTGNKVAFGSAPDLNTAAHEAAHVVQDTRKKRR